MDLVRYCVRNLRGLWWVYAGVENDGGYGRPYGISGILFKVVEGVCDIAMDGFGW